MELNSSPLPLKTWGPIQPALSGEGLAPVSPLASGPQIQSDSFERSALELELSLLQQQISSIVQKLEQLEDKVTAVQSSLSLPAYPPAPPVPPAPAPAKPPEASAPKPAAPAKPPEAAAPKPPAPAPAKSATPKPPAKPAAPKPAPAKPAAAPTTTVQGDDTLWGIAQRVTGDGNRWREIFELNRDQISDPNVIHAGMVLKLPGGATTPAQPAAAEPAAPKPAAAPTTTVQSGDTLSGIAQRTLGNGDRWNEIFQLNRDQVSDPGLIQPGMVLKLPGGANASAPAPQPKPSASSGINTNRDSFYIQQPNGWTCAPTSLTMALAAWGVRPANNNTVNEMINRTGANPNDGLPGNASLIANAARGVGMQAQYVGDGSPASVRAALQRGHGVVLNGSLGVGGHFIYVAGIASDGQFIISDPYRPGVTRMNDGQLNTFANGYGNPRGFAEIWK